jgi:hypothetical protein
MSDKFFTDEELGMTKFRKEMRDPKIIPPQVETKTTPQSGLYPPMGKERMGAAKPWKPKGRK